ncbi:hypothetical protein PUNSTDRAFT_140611 [Punctularia strigosozonata HHB-11173 SS5]|uniref:uncharacterized protein n=1 Tax=Punctularia strigosozonata (strain HHB-11173) TaxID=741275 RepID=UPI0004416F48|nr:uncharacterized protein PUNSTDRAFT_140611 [Punctularia strigosozonata HHB-11173 SS5]EIN14287.1 hypothetical protein PUNSTDRAFT_140611 [Punctularia strigosozonata HHB-11173 SS5]
MNGTHPPNGSRHGHGSDTSTERDYRSSHQSQSNNSQTDQDELPIQDELVPDVTPSIPFWSSKRHLTCGNPTPPPSWSPKLTPWRNTSGKLKTANAALVLCLNIDVDPPDVVKTNPCAILECWVDPHTMPSHKALEAIGTNLQHQFEGLSPKISYKPILDPSYEDLRRFCVQLRKQAKEDTAMFYYNGHGVPRPTASGELWCFNRNYTQYIPVSLQEIQSWLGSPCIYIWDCSAAGHLLQNFKTFAEKRDAENNMKRGGYPDGMAPFMDSIQLAACAANEMLPSSPELPADLFTSCLTSPIDIALRFFVNNHQLPNNLTADEVMQLPGDLKDRRTPLGELNWIFTAITDTIAWTTFSRDVFTRLYRSDLLIASLFRNFLLAERIMKNYNCTPHTYPPLPPTNTHPLWASWDLAVDACLRQLDSMIGKGKASDLPVMPSASRARRAQAAAQAGSDLAHSYVPSRFFADQLTAFEVWISRGGSALTKRGPMSLPFQQSDAEMVTTLPGASTDLPSPQHLLPRKPPEQLPIVLQILLSQPHRLRALILLSQFVDLGPWAVNLALTIGIFPYISKLLQAAGPELRPVLIFIWARILAVDPMSQVELVNNQGYKYFANILGLREEPRHQILPNKAEHKAMCAFILSAIARGHVPGQLACMRDKVFDNCIVLLNEGDFLLRQWVALCIAQLWDSNDEIKVYGVDTGTQDKLLEILQDDSPEVRAAALYALGTFLGASGSAAEDKPGGGGSGSMPQLEERTHFRMETAVVTAATLTLQDDASPMVKKELIVLISCLVKEWRGHFVICAWIHWEEDERERRGVGTRRDAYGDDDDDDVSAQALAEWLDNFADDEQLREENRVLLSSFYTIFCFLLEYSVDPYPEVAANAQTLVDYIIALLLDSPFTKIPSCSVKAPRTPPAPRSPVANGHRSRVPSLTSLASTATAVTTDKIRPSITRADSVGGAITNSVSNTLKRASSVASVLRGFAGGVAFPSLDESSSSRGTTIPARHERQDLSRPPSPNLNLARYTSPYSLSPEPGFRTRTPSPAPSEQARTPQFDPADVMEALMEEDFERLRARRRTGSTHSMDSTMSVVGGLGTGVGIRDVLPLKSRFWDWCAEYFKEPQMRQAENDEPGSVQYNYLVWRQSRIDQVIKETEKQAKHADNCQWDRPVRTLYTPGIPLSMTFHAYDQHLIIADERDMISVWDWSRRKQLNKWFNGSSAGAGITSLHIINQDVGGIVMAGSADGVVRLYRNYDPTVEQGEVQMVSSFRVMPDGLHMSRGAGLVMDWTQTSGTLLTGGDSRHIRLWDAHTENGVLNYDTNTESPVTAMVSDDVTSQTFVASFGDGTIKVFDRRLDEEDAIVRSYRAHSSWVQSVRYHPLYGQRFFSAGLDGEVKLWDLRGDDAGYFKAWDLYPNGLAAFDVHPHTGVFAATSAINLTQYRHQRVSVYNVKSTTPLSSLNVPTTLTAAPSKPYPSAYMPRWNSLVFHPQEMLYAVGGPDGSVRILGCKLPPAAPIGS